MSIELFPDSEEYAQKKWLRNWRSKTKR